ncbi:uncharacterized protein LOC142345402 [Convolutriloba macropyga]|uniref:uncharacterized protein LOC142345402 n=1 Tax=Convolutriloba macropyga TaxID=536237 RepID=UPI003F51C0DD
MSKRLPNSVIIGTGEYVTGYVPGGGSKSDKSCGVVGLVHFDMRRRGLIGERILIAGTNGTKFPPAREHLKRLIDGRYRDLSSSFESFPSDDCKRDPNAYKEALNQLQEGDLVSVFTPDDTHFEMTKEALERGCHVMVAKPLVLEFEQHKVLADLAMKKNRLLLVEVHKRFDPIYSDARQRLNSGQMGPFGYFYSYMSQPKFQLDTFQAWAGISSDISYYLNSHHVDWHVWAMAGRGRPVSVRATSSSGQAEKRFGDGRKCEDTITLMVDWENKESGSGDDGCNSGMKGHAVYTSSWTDPVSDVHSQQHFYCQAHHGFLKADQAHRGYYVSTDQDGYKSVNPLYMKYTTDAEGYYNGQSGYGYQSFEKFVLAAHQVNEGTKLASDYNNLLPSAVSTLQVTAILHAGRISLDSQNSTVRINYTEQENLFKPTSLTVLSN